VDRGRLFTLDAAHERAVGRVDAVNHVGEIFSIADGFIGREGIGRECHLRRSCWSAASNPHSMAASVDTCGTLWKMIAAGIAVRDCVRPDGTRRGDLPRGKLRFGTLEIG